MGVGAKYFTDQFLNLYAIEIQKIPTLGTVNFVKVDQSLKIHMPFSALFFKMINYY